MPALRRSRSAGVLIGLLVTCFSVAALGGLSTTSGVATWYPTLDKPPWTPPNWAFGPVWTFLYTAMAVAAWDVVRRSPHEARGAMAWFGMQLVLNALWSPIFFAWQLTGVALAVITGLWAAVAICIPLFWTFSRPAAGVMGVYLAWVTIAWSLNAWVWWFN